MRSLIVLFAITCCSFVYADEPPSLSRIFPLGGQRGTEVEIAIKGKFGDGDLSFWCNNAGLTWSKTEQENTLKVSISDDAPLGVCYMRLVNQHGVSDAKPFIVGVIPEHVEQEPNDRPGEAGLIEPSTGLINGVLEKRGDVDHYKISVSAGETLIASIQAERGLKSEADVTLQLTDLHGNVLTENLDYHGLDPQIVWTAPSEQQVTLRVFGFPANPNSTISLAGGENYVYRLTVTKGAWCEGVLPLAVSADEPTELHAFGWNLADASSISITAGPATQSSPSGPLHPVQVAGSPNSFLLPVTSFPVVNLAKRETDAATAVQQVELPAVVCGNICKPNQEDLLEFSAAKDSLWSLVLESRELGYPLDAVLTIEDAATGKQLTQVDDVNRQADPVIQWKAPADGLFRLKIADINGAATENNLYRLWIKPQQPEIRVSVSQSAFSGKVGETLEIPIKIERILGFDQTVEFQLETQVQGLEFTSMTSEPNGDSAKEVKVKLSSVSPLTREIRILVKVNGAEAIILPVSDPATGLTDLWVTFR